METITHAVQRLQRKAAQQVLDGSMKNDVECLQEAVANIAKKIADMETKTDQDFASVTGKVAAIDGKFTKMKSGLWDAAKAKD